MDERQPDKQLIDHIKSCKSTSREQRSQEDHQTFTCHQTTTRLQVLLPQPVVTRNNNNNNIERPKRSYYLGGAQQQLNKPPVADKKIKEQLSNRKFTQMIITTNQQRSPLQRQQQVVAKTHLLLLIAICTVFQQINAQCPINSMTSFERITGVTVKDTMLLSVLYTTAPNMTALSQLSPELTRQIAAAGAAGGLNIPITAECNNRCRRSFKCRAFLVDYGRHTCYSIEQSSSSSAIGGGGGVGSSLAGGHLRTSPPIQLVATQERTSYFEKVCLNSAPSDCERAWVYERVLAYHLHGEDDKLIEDVSTRLKCQEHCLNEREFRCRSGEYDYLTMQCRLSRIDRHTKPNAFRPTTNNVDYFENQCVPAGHQCNAFDRYEDQDLARAEIVRSANTSDQCQQICTQIIKAFICRSFTWNPATGKCYLNSVNTFMVGGVERLLSAPGLMYYQRNDCVDLKLECDTNAMTLSLRTNEPFRGRMYVRDEPNACETLGRSSLHSSLSIPFHSQAGARCATRELPSRYSSVVVVQQHPMIQRKSDRYIKLVCDFQTSNKTIVSSYNVVANPWTSAALINATSFAPKIRLRITDRSGADITGAKLGDELYLRIEAESDSVYDMTARSVLAKSGNTEESIALIDKDGCPTDFRIFPPLKKLNRRTIVGKFDAFKFSSDVVVRFQVDVQFCLNQCPPTNCEHNLMMSAGANQQIGTENAYMNNNELTTMSAGVDSLGSTLSSTQSTPFQQRNSGVGLLGADQSSSSTINRHQNHHHHQQQQQHHVRAPTNFTGQPHYLDQFSDQGFYNSAAINQRVNNLSGRSPATTTTTTTTTNSLAELANNFSQSNQQMLDSLTSSLPASSSSAAAAGNLGDAQMFEHSRAANVPHGAKLVDAKRDQRPKTLPVQSSNSIAEQQLSAGMLDGGQLSDLSVESAGMNNAKRRRRRRDTSLNEQQQQNSPATRHVPLQREIIVESTPPVRPTTQQQQQQLQTSNKWSSEQQVPVKANGQLTTTTTTANSNQNGPIYDLNDQQRTSATTTTTTPDEQQDGGTLLCTTRHSLVLASMAFCAVQFVTVALCLLTWMHKKDVKFKVKHPIEDRLY